MLALILPPGGIISIASAALPFGLPPTIFWPYFAGIATLAIGLVTASRAGAAPSDWQDQFIRFGPVCFAAPMAVFGAEHFVFSESVARLVPQWIPGHLFWTYLVGIALICAALSFAANRFVPLSSALLGIMLLLFVALLHVPAWYRIPLPNRFHNLVLRDSLLGICSCALAATFTDAWRKHRSHLVVTIARSVVAASMIVYGLDHFAEPLAAPGLPRAGIEMVSTPAWIPGPELLAYIVGCLEIACGFGLFIPKFARLAATSLGVLILALTFGLYLPIDLARPSSIGIGLNYLAIHFALAGAALLLARALPAPAAQPAGATLDAAARSNYAVELER